MLLNKSILIIVLCPARDGSENPLPFLWERLERTARPVCLAGAAKIIYRYFFITLSNSRLLSFSLMESRLSKDFLPRHKPISIFR